MKLTYEKNGDYLIPNLTANEEPEGTLTKYGMMRKNFLQEHRMEQIEKEVSVSFWERYDEDHTVVRFATSWATREADLEHLWEILDRIEAEREK